MDGQDKQDGTRKLRNPISILSLNPVYPVHPC